MTLWVPVEWLLDHILSTKLLRANQNDWVDAKEDQPWLSALDRQYQRLGDKSGKLILADL